MVAIRPEVSHDVLGLCLETLATVSEVVWEAGGTFYLISIPLKLPRWAERQYGRKLEKLRALKSQFDPDSLIKSGPGAFLIDRE